MSVIRYVDTAWSRQIALLLEARGKPSQAILAALGLDAAVVMQPDARIPFVKHVALLEAAAKHLNDPLFGLHFGSRVDPLESGLVGYASASSATIGDALSFVVEYGRVFTEGARLTINTDDRQAVLVVEVIDQEVRQFRQLDEFGLSVLVNFLRTLSTRRLTPRRIEFRHNRRGDIHAFESCFGGQVAFGRNRNAVFLDRELLALPCQAADQRLLRILKSYCEEILEKRLKTEDFEHEVEHMIASLLPSGAVTARIVARHLAMSDRTLARRLSKRGLTFGQLLDTTRRRLALRYLADGPQQLSQIAYLLGYSGPSAFNHAFRRWTGQSPSDYKAGAK